MLIQVATKSSGKKGSGPYHKPDCELEKDSVSQKGMSLNCGDTEYLRFEEEMLQDAERGSFKP